MLSLARNGAALALWVCTMAAFGQPGQVSAPAARDAGVQWFRHAKFGLFIRWGLFAAPAGEWKGQVFPGPGEWIMRDARIPAREYEQLAARFNPAEFDAEAWVKFAEDSGAKYIIVNAKDHDGFAMFQSAVSRYNIVDAAPFHRDPLKELASACAKHGMKLGFYYSQEQDWHEPDAPGNDWDFGPDDKKDFDRYLRRKAEPQVKELLSNYGPVALMWFDPPRLVNGRRAQAFVDLVHSLQPATLVNERPGGFLSMADNTIPAGVVQGDWVVPETINNTSGFKKYDNAWKSLDDLVFKLVDIVSKGGNLLMYVGPTAEGIIPRPTLVTLQNVGGWLKSNGEAIYGAGSTPFGSEFGAANWRCTAKPGRLFITLFQWPKGPLELEHVSDRIVKAYLFADPSHGALKFTQGKGHVAVVLPEDPPVVGQIPERVNREIFKASMRAHLRCVLVLETLKN